MASVAYDHASRTYPGNPKPSVDQLNLEIADGEFLVLVGPSGCGKSTALRMLAGLEDINAGRILIGGRDVTRVPPKDRDIAMVFQNYALYPHMTVRFHARVQQKTFLFFQFDLNSDAVENLKLDPNGDH